MTTPTSTESPSCVSSFASLFGIVLLAATLRTPLTTVGPLLGQIRAATGLGIASAGLLNTLPLLALGIGSLAAPVLGRRWGLERVLFYSMLLLSVGVVLRSLFGVGALFTGTLLLGAAIAIGNVLLPALIKRDYPQRIGKMTGLFVITMALSSGIAAGVAVPLANVLPGDWRTSLAFALVVSVPAAFVWYRRARRADAQAVAAAATPHANVWGSWLAWQVTLLNGIQAMSFYALVAWMPSMVFEMNGSSAATGGWLMFLIQILALAGSIMVSSLLGRFRDQRWLGVVVSALCMIGFAGLAWRPAWAAMWIAIAGFGLGSSLTLALAFISLRSSSPSQAASLSAMSQCLGYLIGAAGPLVCGIVRDRASSWMPVLWGLAVVSILQAWMAWGAGRRLHIGETP